MLSGSSRHLPLPLTVSTTLSRPLLLLLLLAASVAQAGTASPSLRSRDDDPLNINWGSAPPSADDPILSTGALRDTSYLPAQIGGIVGAYAVSLVLVAVTLLSLAKKRRRALEAAAGEIEFEELQKGLYPAELPPDAYKSLQVITHFTTNGDAVPNFSYPSPTQSEFFQPVPFADPSHVSRLASSPGTDYSVDQAIVAADRAMAQSQLEDMYKYVMEHEEAKERGVVLDAPSIAGSARQSASSSRTNLSKKERTKPASLNLNAANDDKSPSKTSSLLSALRSPRKKSGKAVSISSPIMTPQSATFPRHEPQQMGAIPPRHYMPPPPPPPVPTDQFPYVARDRATGAPMTQNMSPESVQSIDERMGLQLGPATTVPRHFRNVSQAPTEVDPESAASEHSLAPLVPLPSSPKPNGRFPSLPSSPKPGATFQRTNTPSAVRTGGSLPLRAYEPAMTSPSAITHTTKQTVFERKSPLSPGGGRTPFTAGATPYSPYQPFTPCMPVTPGLVTKEDRKRMKRMVPKTPTMEMVRSAEDVW